MSKWILCLYVLRLIFRRKCVCSVLVLSKWHKSSFTVQILVTPSYLLSILIFILLRLCASLFFFFVAVFPTHIKQKFFFRKMSYASIVILVTSSEMIIPQVVCAYSNRVRPQTIFQVRKVSPVHTTMNLTHIKYR